MSNAALSAQKELQPIGDHARQVGTALRKAVGTVRIHSLSLHDLQGDTLFLSEGVLGPDEHGSVLEAAARLGGNPAKSSLRSALGDGRVACFLAARNLAGTLGALAMIIVDERVAGNAPANWLDNPQSLALLQDFGARFAGPARPVSDLTSSRPRLVHPGARTHTDVAPPTPAKLDTTQLRLHVQQFIQLRTGGRTRRYEVLLRSSRPDARDRLPEELAAQLADANHAKVVDRFVVTELIQWLGANKACWDQDPAVFSVNVTAHSVSDETFTEYVIRQLRERNIAAKYLGFEISESQIQASPDAAAAFIKRCEKLGLSVTVDDFTLTDAAVALLASPAIKVIKINSKLTLNALRSKLAQAKVVAIAQMAKILGQHCVAKRIESKMARHWLIGAGVDFAQGNLLEKSRPLDSLRAKP
ncbi:MAG: EAL domain-containing protein [Steroidobacteraceae bacterium]